MLVLSISAVAGARVLRSRHIYIWHDPVRPLRSVGDVAGQKSALIEVGPRSRHTDCLLGGRVEFNHHGAIHFRSIHVVDALHAHKVLAVVLHIHHILVACILILLSLAVVQMLMNRNVLKVVLILLLAAESQFSALVQLVGVTFPRNVHHNEVFAQLVLVSIIEPHGVMVNLARILHSDQLGLVCWLDAGASDGLSLIHI